MRLCPDCGGVLAAAGWHCGSCGYQAPQRDGFVALAPELAQKAEGFDPALFTELAALEAGNFWFRARNRLIVWALQRYAPGFGNLLEVGCGTGYVLQGIAAAFPQARLVASEAETEGLRFAAQRVPAAEFLQMDARRMPYEQEFDVIGAFDVIEHIGEDETVLAQMRCALRPGGSLLLTVPQHPFLWSEYDVRAHHVRRYTRSELRQKLGRAGFSVVRMTSFVSVLLPLMMLSRMARRAAAADYDPLAELRIGRVANAVLERALDAERLLIRAGLPLPCGGSLLAVARAPA
ncbi:MAG: methyltransferase domain-containing protein [Burkholderiales bacterium]|nr:methyltransferase domain-containing protein [Burkholderiales bacterium]